MSTLVLPVVAEIDALGLRHDSTDDSLIAQCDHATLAGALASAGMLVDALIVDAPYSSRTHAGHGERQGSRVSRGDDGADRRALEYSAWSSADIAAFVVRWAPRTRGWVCSLTDHVLAPDWERIATAHGRYAFSPLACVESGSRVRITGDGPAQWSTWLCASRPSSREWATWGALPGAYVGSAEKKPVVGGKPAWLMRAIVRDYSRPGDIVCDPCAGGGTTLVAAIEEGRIAIGCEPDAGRYEIAERRMREARRPLIRERRAAEQISMEVG